MRVIAAVLAGPALLAVDAGAQNRPPLEGPLTWVALTLTDDASEDDLFMVPQRPELTGSPLDGATADHVLAVLDSGAATHLVNYPDGVDLGLDWTWRTGNTLPVGGTGGTIDADITWPLGLFVHGAQWLQPGAVAQPARMIGEGNCPVAVNTEENFLAGSSLPTVVGMPLLPYYPVRVENSREVRLKHRGELVRSAHATFYDGPADPELPVYPHLVPLEYTPAGLPDVLWIPELDPITFEFVPTTPAVVGLGALLRTASSSLELGEGTRNVTVQLVVDTAAQATLVSRNVAIDLGFPLAEPEFEVEVEGLGGSGMLPGFYVDRLDLPTAAGGISWTDVPVVVRDITGPEGVVIDGIFGSNLLGNRDFLINAAAASPYLEISDTLIPPRPEITAIRRTGDEIEVDWVCRPASPELRLETSGDPTAGDGGWTTVAIAELSSLSGTLSAGATDDQAFFRIVAETE